MALAQDLTVGERFGDWIVVEKRSDLLRVSAPQAFPVCATCWPADAFESVHVAVTHHGPNEVLRLVLIGRRPGTSLFVAAAPSDDRGLPLIQAAAHIAKVLQLPPTRSGTSAREI